MHFDSTVTLGNLITALSFLLLAVFAWRDMAWRVTNLEKWRTEHMIDADARDELIRVNGKILDHVRWQSERMGGRQFEIEEKH